MNEYTISNEATGLFIGIFTAEQYNEMRNTTVESGYVATSHGEGYEEVETCAEAVAQAIEWAEDAVDNNTSLIQRSTGDAEFDGYDAAALEAENEDLAAFIARINA